MQRLSRAGVTMTDLINTLLWLNREERTAPFEEDVRLDEEVEETVKSLRYLVDKKNIQLECHTEFCKVHLAKVACQIVLNNLIRNAFQHCWSGRIRICQRAEKIEIRNRLHEDGAFDAEQGFGLGILLIEKLCRQFSWHYSSHAIDGEHVTVIEFKPSLNMSTGESV
ncbi:hypothetical protein [Thiomicrorhabdus sp.]|uniref:hypothetical protein n=1 Tax=Thiomicrorhabdus sp. TaxID=2039724 RepID=UPI0029C890FF|nr:hypothetical protein [Thiomicrorhabdus sp.]